MSIFINARGQLRDKDFFGKEISYKISKSIPLNKKNQSEIKLAHAQIKALYFQVEKKPTSKELKEMVMTFYQSPLSTQQAVLRDGISPKATPKEELVLTQLFTLYENFINENRTHKTKNLDLARINTWYLYLNSKGNKHTLKDIDRKFISDFVNWRYEFRKPNCSRKGQVSDSVVKKETLELQKCLVWNHKEGNISKLPSTIYGKLDIPLRGNKKAILPLELQEQLGFLKSLENEDPYFHDYFLLLLICGLRVGEINTLSPTSFNLDHGTLQIHNISIGNTIVGGKTESAPRVLPLNPTLIAIYERGHIFQSKFTHKIGKNTYEKSIKGSRDDRLHSFISRRKREGKLTKDFHPHRLRHTFVTNNLQANRRDLEVSRWAGHKSIIITLDRYGKYLRLGIPKLVQAYEEHLKWLEEDYFK